MTTPKQTEKKQQVAQLLTTSTYSDVKNAHGWRTDEKIRVEKLSLNFNVSAAEISKSRTHLNIKHEISKR